jgi:hypothetical protein
LASRTPRERIAAADLFAKSAGEVKGQQSFRQGGLEIWMPPASAARESVEVERAFSSNVSSVRRLPIGLHALSINAGCRKEDCGS